MEQLTHISETYHSIISEAEQQLSKVKRSIYRIGTLRLLLFVAGFAGIIYFWSSGWILIIATLCLTFIPFLALVKYHNRLFYQKDYLEKKIEINRQELRALDYDTSAFDGGDEFINPAHLYSFDLDLFGNHSLFQYINRTSTQLRRERLAAWFDEHLKEKAKIKKRQEAVRELAPDIKIRQRFRILGLLYKGKFADAKEIKTWAASPSYYRQKAFYRILPFIALTINAVFIGLAIAGVTTFSTAGGVFVLIALLSFLFSKGIGQMQTLYGKKMQILGTYAHLISIIEEQNIQSAALQEIKALIGDSKKTASQAVKRLTKLMNALDQRNNIMMTIILNGLFFWELRQAMRIEAWKERFAVDMPHWQLSAKWMLIALWQPSLTIIRITFIRKLQLHLSAPKRNPWDTL